MIKSVHIANFQSHKETFIEFDNGVNALIGLSDSGKTAVIRALRWVLFNKPGGDAFRSYWGGDTAVKVVFSSGDEVVRSKTNTLNLYNVNGKDLAGFGQDVPEEVKAILNINNINFSSQMDSPFMLGDSPGEVAQQLNKAAQLDLIDKSASALRKRLSNVSSDLKHNENQLAEQTTRLKDFDFIPALEADVQQLEQSCQMLGIRKQEHQALSTLLSSTKTNIKSVQELEQQIPPVKDVRALDSAVAALQDKRSTHGKIDALLDDIDKAQETLDRCKGIEADGKAVAKLEKLVLQLKDKKELFASLAALDNHIDTTQIDIEQSKDTIESMQQEYDALFPDVCPLCEK